MSLKDSQRGCVNASRIFGISIALEGVRESKLLNLSCRNGLCREYLATGSALDRSAHALKDETDR